MAVALCKFGFDGRMPFLSEGTEGNSVFCVLFNEFKIIVQYFLEKLLHDCLLFRRLYFLWRLRFLFSLYRCIIGPFRPPFTPNAERVLAKICGLLRFVCCSQYCGFSGHSACANGPRRRRAGCTVTWDYICFNLSKYNKSLTTLYSNLCEITEKIAGFP